MYFVLGTYVSLYTPFCNYMYISTSVSQEMKLFSCTITCFTETRFMISSMLT